MSRLDEELRILRANLAVLEGKKRIELELAAAKKANPMKRLETIITTTRQNGEHYYEKRRWPEYHAATNTVSFLEPIVDMLKNIQERLDVLEQK